MKNMTITPTPQPDQSFRRARRCAFPLAHGQHLTRFSVKVTLGARASLQLSWTCPSRTFDVLAESPQAAADLIEDEFNLRAEPCTGVEVMGPRGGLPVKRWWGWESAIGSALGLTRQPSAEQLTFL